MDSTTILSSLTNGHCSLSDTSFDKDDGLTLIPVGKDRLSLHGLQGSSPALSSQQFVSRGDHYHHQDLHTRSIRAA